MGYYDNKQLITDIKRRVFLLHVVVDEWNAYYVESGETDSIAGARYAKDNDRRNHCINTGTAIASALSQ